MQFRLTKAALIFLMGHIAFLAFAAMIFAAG
jgi:hypothetical protein